MTWSEAKGFIQGKLDCMKKCDIFDKEDNISDNDCDNCIYCYAQGTFVEQKEAFEIAIKALEKQDKIKEVFTHYSFSGFEMDVLSDCLQCLSEIKDILKRRVTENE